VWDEIKQQVMGALEKLWKAVKSAWDDMLKELDGKHKNKIGDEKCEAWAKKPEAGQAGTANGAHHDGSSLCQSCGTAEATSNCGNLCYRKTVLSKDGSDECKGASSSVRPPTCVLTHACQCR